jgi:hypothetical protein
LLQLAACSLGLSAISQQYFSLTTNQPPATSQQYFSLRTNQHQPSATSQTNRPLILRVRNPSSSAFVYREPTPDEGMNSEQETGGTAQTSGQRGCFIVGCLESSVSYLIEICDSLFPAGFSPCDPAAACSHDRIYPACRGAVLPAWPTRGLGGKMATSV